MQANQNQQKKLKQQKKKNKTDLTKTYRDIGPYLGLGTQLAASIVLMFFLGRWLDQYFDTEPWLTICFSLFGGFAGIYNVIKATLLLNKKQQSEKDN